MSWAYGVARWIGGFTKVAIYPTSTNSLQTVVVHATLIQGPRHIRWQTTWLTCKQLNWHQLRVPKITLGTCSWTNKEHFPLKMYSHSSRGTEVAALKGHWLLSKWLECTAAKNPDNSLKLMWASPYIPPNPLCKHNGSDVIKWHHNHLLPSSGGKNLVHVQ